MRSTDAAALPQSVGTRRLTLQRVYQRHYSDKLLARPIPTVFVPSGEAVLTVLLGNLEHLLNHKHQLFFYLKLLGVVVTTRDLYRLRKEGATGDE